MKRHQIVITIVAALALVPHVRAEIVPNVPDLSMIVTDGPINAIAATDNLIYVGGQFTTIGQKSGNAIPFNVNSGLPLSTFPNVSGPIVNGLGPYIAVIISDGSGGWYIGGNFSSIGGLAQSYLAHVLANGAVDQNFRPQFSRSVQALVLDASTLYVGGEFETVNGQASVGLALLDAASGALLPWSFHPNGQIYSMSLSNNILYVGGNFTRINGTIGRNFLAAFDLANNTLSDWNPAPSQQVNAILPDGNTVFIGGFFERVNGVDRNYAAAIDRTTGALLPWSPRPDRVVFALSKKGSTIFLGGGFTNVQGQNHPSLAAVDDIDGHPITSSFQIRANPAFPLTTRVRALAQVGSTLYVGGDFGFVGNSPRLNAAAFDSDTYTLQSWSPEPNRSVRSFAATGGILYMGGDFSILRGRDRNGLAAFEAASGVVTDFRADVSPGGIVSALAVSNSHVFVGGSFTSVKGSPHHQLVALDAISGDPLPWNLDADGAVTQFKVNNGKIYMRGYFSRVAGQARKYLAAIDGATGQLTLWKPTPDNYVNAIEVGNSVYVSGLFETINGLPRKYLAALDKVTGAPTSWPAEVSNPVDSLVLSGSTLYAGGNFTQIGHPLVPRSDLAALSVNSGVALDWTPPDTFGAVKAMALSGTTLYISGVFYFAERNHQGTFLEAVSTDSGALLDWNPQVNTFATAMEYRNGALYLGGTFSFFQGKWCPYLARFGSALLPPFGPGNGGGGPPPAGSAWFGTFKTVFNPLKEGSLPIGIEVSENSAFELSVLDRNGTIVRLLANLTTDTNETMFWDGRNAQGEMVASGIYLLHLKSGGASVTKKIAVMK